MDVIDKKRVVGIDDTHIDNFLCPICWKVFTEPTVTRCCGQTYCKTCITRWINERHVCPEDGRPLAPHLLMSAPMLIRKLLNDLSVKCVNHEKGCSAVLRRDQLDRHLEECRHRYEEIRPTIYFPSCSADNAVNYEFWLEFRLRQVLMEGIRIRKKDVTIIKGSEENVFIALFDSDDLDFEVQVENSSDHNVCYKLKLDDQVKGHCSVVRQGMTSSLKTLESSGRNLHYSSRPADERTVVVRNAYRSQTFLRPSQTWTRPSQTWSRPSQTRPLDSCSRLTFKVEIELGDEEYDEIIRHKRLYKVQERNSVMTLRKTNGTRISLMVRREDRVINLTAFTEDKIVLLKYLIEEKEHIATEEQRLIYDGKVLRNELTIRDYNIPFNAQLELITDQFRCADPKMAVAQRGVICFGPDTDQRFMAYNRPFVKSNKYLVEGFTLELRTKSNIWSNH